MSIEKNKESISKFLVSSNSVRWGLLIGVTAIFTLLLYPNIFIAEHSYNLGDVVERNIKAPRDFFIEDNEATQAIRRRAEEEVLTVYDHDTILASELSRRVNTAFADLRAIFEDKKGSRNKNLTQQQQ